MLPMWRRRRAVPFHAALPAGRGQARGVLRGRWWQPRREVGPMNPFARREGAARRQTRGEDEANVSGAMPASHRVHCEGIAFTV